MSDSYDQARTLARAERRWLVDARDRLRSTRATRPVRVTRLARATSPRAAQSPEDQA